MPNTLSNALLAEMFAQESGDPFLCLLTVTNPDFAEDIRLVNNLENITSRSLEYTAFAFKFRLSPDDNESNRDIQIEIDNTSVELMSALRSVTSNINFKLELILASDPDTVQVSYENLVAKGFYYNKGSVKFTLGLDDFLNTKMTSESYDPQNFPGLFR